MILYRIAFALLLLAIALILQAAETALLADDFEKDFNPSWLKVADGIKIVPENPAKPDGNHVARFTQSGLTLVGPPVAPLDWAAARAKQGDFARWKDYQLSFRFRLGQVPVPLYAGLNYLQYDYLWQKHISLFVVAWRVNPHQDNPTESQDMHFVGSHRGDQLSWYLQGPRIHWYGETQHDRFGETYWFEKGAEQPQPLEKQLVDTAWHTFTVRVKGDETVITFDGKPYFKGNDDHILQGGIAITTTWGECTPGYLDIDDILVEPVE